MQGGLRVNEDIQLYIRPKKPLETIAHGTPAAYTNDKCRCVDCKRAWAAYTKRRRNV